MRTGSHTSAKTITSSPVTPAKVASAVAPVKQCVCQEIASETAGSACCEIAACAAAAAIVLLVASAVPATVASHRGTSVSTSSIGRLSRGSGGDGHHAIAAWLGRGGHPELGHCACIWVACRNWYLHHLARDSIHGQLNLKLRNLCLSRLRLSHWCRGRSLVRRGWVLSGRVGWRWSTSSSSSRATASYGRTA